jgi:hypothetical protein
MCLCDLRSESLAAKDAKDAKEMQKKEKNENSWQ